MTALTDLTAILAAFFLVTVAPGPANLAVATVAMRAGRRNGLLFGTGLAAGLAIWGLVAATGLGALLQGSATALTALKLAGGAYLVWLAWQSGRSAFSPDAIPAPEPGKGRWIARGLILNLSNPKAVVAWMAALSMGLGTGDTGTHLILPTLLCAAIGALNYTGYALAFSLPGIMAGYQRLRRTIDAAAAALFAAAGAGLIRSAFTRSS
ncbi:LysE family translocator [Aestuariibius sp. 2305UL40-4]|uniref:LysE family translocator n=1 Tax=Aestuariibius violaceus TaxID=3234132 RepID=UPI00345E78DE